MSFEWPWLLAGLAIVPLLALAYALAQRRRRAYAVRFTNLALLQTVAGRGPGVRRHIPPLLYLLGLTALLVGMARPVAVLAVPRADAAVVLVMDVSGSMTANDLQPNRMEAARVAAQSFVESLPDGTEVAVIGFSSTAAVAAPLTREHDDAARAIAGLSPGGGTAIGEGLHLALDQLERAGPGADVERPRAVVLMSDGESQAGRTPAEAAARAASLGIPVHTVGIGQRGATIMLGDQRVRLDERTLQDVAGTTGGRYFYAGEAESLRQIYAALGAAQVRWVPEETEVTALAAGAGVLLLLVGGALALRWFQHLP